MLAPMLVVPDTAKVARLVMAPPKTALPVMVRLFSVGLANSLCRPPLCSCAVLPLKTTFVSTGLPLLLDRPPAQ